MGNIETAQEIYGAFGRGDVGAILDRVADEDTEMRPWAFGGDGSIAAPSHFVDTLQHAEAQGS